MKKLVTVFALFFSITLMSSAIVSASKGTHVATNSSSYYSWCGILCFKMGVEGNYHSTGKKIDQYSKTKAIAETHGTWSAHDKSSSWTYKGKKEGTVKAYATFKNGIVTQWFEMAWQTYDKSSTAKAKA